MEIRDYLTCLLLSFLLVFSSSTKLFAEEDTKPNLRQLTSNLPIDGFCWHPGGQEILFSSRDWIYSVDINEGQIKKLIPGRCPQWIEGGKRFIYFLDVGYDGNRCELWSADRNGEARLRFCKEDFFISSRHSPVVSSNGDMVAFHYSSSGRVGGRLEEIRLVVLGDSLEAKPSVRILFVAPFSTRLLYITGWLDDSHLAVMCDARVVILDIEQVEWVPADNSYTNERFVRLQTSLVGVTETSYEELSGRGKIPYNCEISQDGQWVAQVKHIEGREPFRNKLIVSKLTDEERSILICEDVSPPRFYGLPRFAPAGLKMAFIKWSGDPRYYSGNLRLVDLAEIETKGL